MAICHSRGCIGVPRRLGAWWVRGGDVSKWMRLLYGRGCYTILVGLELQAGSGGVADEAKLSCERTVAMQFSQLKSGIKQIKKVLTFQVSRKVPDFRWRLPEGAMLIKIAGVPRIHLSSPQKT